MKGITPIMSTTLILLITLAIVILVFVFLGGIIGTGEEAAAEGMGHVIEKMATRFRVDHIDLMSDNMYIRNTGGETITGFSVYVDGEPQDIVSDALEPDSLGILSFQKPLKEGTHKIRFVSDGYSVEKEVDIPSKWTVEFTVVGE